MGSTEGHKMIKKKEKRRRTGKKGLLPLLHILLPTDIPSDIF